VWPSALRIVRRLHDIGRTGWWLLLGLIPTIGWIALIVWACQPTVPRRTNMALRRGDKRTHAARLRERHGLAKVAISVLGAACQSDVTRIVATCG
jgi:hypothetical protein